MSDCIRQAGEACAKVELGSPEHDADVYEAIIREAWKVEFLKLRDDFLNQVEWDNRHINEALDIVDQYDMAPVRGNADD